MKETTMWATIAVVGALFVGSMVGVGSLRSYQQDQLMATMIEKGTDPATARCAVKAAADDPICFARGKVMQVPGIVQVPVPKLVMPPQKGFWQSEYIDQ